jgi:transcriptional regulator
MFIAPVDATRGEDEWRPFVESHQFGHLVAPGGPSRALPVVVPTQFVLDGDTVWLHLVRANPVFAALAENPRVLMSVAADWAFIPSSWKVIGDEDPALGIPTTYYGAVQLAGTATVHDERTNPGSVAAILRRQLTALQPDVEVADPGEAHAA